MSSLLRYVCVSLVSGSSKYPLLESKHNWRAQNKAAGQQGRWADKAVEPAQFALVCSSTLLFEVDFFTNLFT